LPDPLLVVSDGAPGMIRAIEECLPRSLRQRCLAHKMRNLQSKVPEDVWPEFKARSMACYQAPSPALARLLRDDIAATYARDLPSAVACLDDDFEASIAHLRFPLGHRRAIRTTNLLERLFGEERRRTKVIPHAFGERAVLKLMYAALIRAAERWRGIKISGFEQRQLKAIRGERDDAFTTRNAPGLSTAFTATSTPVYPATIGLDQAGIGVVAVFSRPPGNPNATPVRLSSSSGQPSGIVRRCSSALRSPRTSFSWAAVMPMSMC